MSDRQLQSTPSTDAGKPLPLNPAHIVVRQRNECCAGIYTGIGICLGVAIAIISFGPAVFLLYHRRCRQIALP